MISIGSIRDKFVLIGTKKKQNKNKFIELQKKTFEKILFVCRKKTNINMNPGKKSCHHDDEDVSKYTRKTLHVTTKEGVFPVDDTEKSGASSKGSTGGDGKFVCYRKTNVK